MLPKKYPLLYGSKWFIASKIYKLKKTIIYEIKYTESP